MRFQNSFFVALLTTALAACGGSGSGGSTASSVGVSSNSSSTTSMVISSSSLSSVLSSSSLSSTDTSTSSAASLINSSVSSAVSTSSAISISSAVSSSAAVSSSSSVDSTTPPSIVVAIQASTAPDTWAENVTVVFEAVDALTQATSNLGSVQLALGDNTLSASAPLALASALAAGSQVRYRITSNASYADTPPQFHCLPTSADAFDIGSYRFQRTLVAGANTINIGCSWATALPVRVVGLAYGQAVTLSFNFIERFDLDYYGVSRSVVHEFTGTGNELTGNFYPAYSFSDQHWILVNQSQAQGGTGGIGLLEGDYEFTVLSSNPNIQCTVPPSYTLSLANSTANPLVISCENTQLLARSRHKAQNDFTQPAVDTSAEFGRAIAVSDDGKWMVVGAPAAQSRGELDRGYAYLYQLAGQGNNRFWQQERRIEAPVASGGIRQDYFGYSVDIAIGNQNGVEYPIIAIGVVGHNGNGDNTAAGASSIGAVYVYRYYFGAMTNTAILRPSHIHGFAQFGSSVSLSADGRFLAVGAQGDSTVFTGIQARARNESVVWPNSAQTNQVTGAVYVFEADGSSNMNWQQVALFKPDATQFESANFGQSVALDASGTFLAVGAPYEYTAQIGTYAAINNSVDSGADIGAVMLYSRAGAAWSTRAYIKPTALVDAAGASYLSAYFGSQVAIRTTDSSLSLAVGAPQSNGLNYHGRTTVFHGESLTGNGTDLLTSVAQIDSPAELTGGLRGLAFAANAPVLAIGHINPSGGTNVSEPQRYGQVQLFNLSSNQDGVVVQAGVAGYRPAHDVQNSGGAISNNGNFGSAVGISGDGSRVIVGAPTESCGITNPDVNPVNCGQFLSGDATGSIYAFDR